MKRIIRSTGIFLIISAAVSGCNDAGYQTIENALYINEAAPDSPNQQVESLTVEGETTVSIHLRLAQPLEEDLHATLDFAPEFVEEYNSRNDAGYEILPEEYVSFDKETVIEAGNTSSEAIEITVSEFETGDGKAYCVPVKIVSADTDVKIMSATSRIMYLLITPLKQVVPEMDYAVVPDGSSAGDWNIETSEWTLEGWVWMDSFSINNQAIFSATVSKGTEIYVRFGDADVDYDKLQIKTYGSQFNSSRSFEPETWYHVAFTCANNKCTLYINGEEDSSMDLSGTDYVINNLMLCSSGSYFRANARMAQVRFWSKALTQSAIQNSMTKEVPADSEGLFGYWKLDEGTGDIFYDSTSNGFDLHCSVPPEWTTEEVNFSDPNQEG